MCVTAVKRLKHFLVLFTRCSECVLVQFYPWLNFIFHYFKLIIVHYHTPNRGKIY